MKIYDAGNNLIQKESYRYIRNTVSDPFNGVRVKQIVSVSGRFNAYMPLNFFACMRNWTYIGATLISNKTTTLYNGGVATVANLDNQYNSKNQLMTVSQVNSTGGSLVKSYKYPQDFASGNNIYAEMVTKNMVAPVIEQVSTHNNTETGRIKTDYFKDSQKTSGLILPEKVQTSASGAANFRTDITYGRYDSKGNIRQYTTLDEVNTVYLWGYKGQYPIAEIKNTTYEAVQNAVSSVFSMTVETLSSQTTPNETSLTNKSLQNALPDAMVTTYTYKPLVGIWKMQDPRGVVTEYVYDDFGRLKQVLVDGKKESEYQYHYRE